MNGNNSLEAVDGTWKSSCNIKFVRKKTLMINQLIIHLEISSFCDLMKKQNHALKIIKFT